MGYPAVFNKNLFFVKEHVGMFKAANNYDIYDPETNEQIIHCREEKLGFFTKILRFTDYKRLTPFNVELKEPDGPTLISVKRGVTFFRSVVDVLDASGNRIGYFKQKLLSIGGKFELYTDSDEYLCTLKGKWTSWEFSFIREDKLFAKVTKKWAGLGKELFTSADNYVLQIDESVPEDNPIRPLVIGAVMCIDMVLKE